MILYAITYPSICPWTIRHAFVVLTPVSGYWDVSTLDPALSARDLGVPLFHHLSTHLRNHLIHILYLPSISRDGILGRVPEGSPGHTQPNPMYYLIPVSHFAYYIINFCTVLLAVLEHCS